MPDVQGAPRGGAVPLLQDPVHRQQPGRGRGRQPDEEHPHGEAGQVLLRAQDDSTAQVGRHLTTLNGKISYKRLCGLVSVARISRKTGSTQPLIVITALQSM